MKKSYFERYKWPKILLKIAGLYNVCWGTSVILFPTLFFDFMGAPYPTYMSIWQCVGMIVGVYGVGYIIAAHNPLKHWVIIFVGLLGKMFGPIGFVYHVILGTFPASFAWVILGNDLIWWIPFSIILYNVYKESKNA
ncbi:alkyl hydroperoxide reductase [Candidatus Marinamargulisbacteria bacterium SCGC AG-343-D04]|nr:alkyl hydroperoxide reductase [Candidatus Marinamargulisbacteria bacterium SCGC AG-343-D04]